MTENDIIHQITLGQTKAPNCFGVGDDAALVADQRMVTQDTMIEGIHWDEKLSSADVGWKIVAINASDIGAMGGLPEWCTLSISLPKSIDDNWISQFSRGMREALAHWNISLIGGDTTRNTKGIVLSMTMGSRRGYNWAWQHDAQLDDTIWVTGTLGDAAAGFYDPKAHPHNTALQRPTPPVQFAHKITHNKLIHAMTDISDGLHSEIKRICERSGLGAKIDPKALPASSVLYRNKKALAYQTAFGEDYEYLFTAPKRSETILRQMAARHGIAIHKIGKILSQANGVQLEDTEWPPPLFTHFE